MEVIFTPKAISDLNTWKKSGNIGVQKKIEAILKNIKQTPFEGIGKPEPLKHDLSGKWSRRINREHRIIYKVELEEVKIYSLYGHYE